MLRGKYIHIKLKWDRFTSIYLPGFVDKEPLTRDDVSPSCEEVIWVELCKRVLKTSDAEGDDNIEPSTWLKFFVETPETNLLDTVVVLVMVELNWDVVSRDPLG